MVHVRNTQDDREGLPLPRQPEAGGLRVVVVTGFGAGKIEWWADEEVERCECGWCGDDRK